MTSPRNTGAALLAAAAGALSVFGHAPTAFFPAFIIGAALLTHLWLRTETPRSAAWLGFFFGFGQFGAGVSWVYISMNRFGGMLPPLAATATLGFCIYLALYPALAGWLQARLVHSPAVRAMLVIPALWTFTEWLRGWVLTGFPWIAPGYAALDTPFAGFAPLGGVHLVSLAVLSAVGMLWCVAVGQARIAALAALGVILAAGQLLRGMQWSEPHGEPLAVSLLQGNVPQSLKFDPQRYTRTLETYARLTEQSRAQLIVLPETAVPRFLDTVDPRYLERLGEAARRNNGNLLLGVPTRTATGEYRNSVVSLGVSPRQTYHKTHLVAFGEFIPAGFGWVVRAMSIPLSDFSPGPAKQPPLALADQRVAVNICYEDLFGEEIARALPDATLLVNASNVAWFGDSLAPGQHLAIARMRSIETSRTTLTATNTGVTAAIDRDGAVLASLPQFREGRLDATVRGYRGTTPYVRFGDTLALATVLALLALVRLRRPQGVPRNG